MKKRILFDIGHPAQVHQFKYVYKELSKCGWKGLFTAKEKEVSIYLLEKYKLPYINLGMPKKGLLLKILNIPHTLGRFIRIIEGFKPDLIVSRFSVHASLGAFIKNIPHIGLTDTESVVFLDKLAGMFSSAKLTAFSYRKNLGRNHFRYSGNKELFYLHPNRFKADETILKALGLNPGDKYLIIRFVSWQAHHDIGQSGFKNSEKISFVEKMNKYAKVFISSEQKLLPQLEPYRITLPPEKLHDALAFASLYIGEGGTMASEAACLGTPAIYVNTIDTGYLRDEEKYGLLFPIIDCELIRQKAIEILNQENSKEKFQIYKLLFLSDKIDVTAFFVWFIENYPDSVREIREHPEIQYRFK